MKKIPITNKEYALVDDEDFKSLATQKWSFGGGEGGRKYVMRSRWIKKRKKSESIYLHRFILGLVGKTYQVDHIDGNRLNNQKSNLRVCRQRQNSSNQGNRVNNVSGFKGVCFDNTNRKWIATIKVNYKSKFLGYFNSKIDAAKAYDRAAISFWGKFAKTNQMPGNFK